VRGVAGVGDRGGGAGGGVETQGASEMKKQMTEPRLKLWGRWKPGAEHGRDAQRHCLLFLRRFASQPELRRRVGYQ